MDDRVIEADGSAQVSVEDVAPLVYVLGLERQVEAVVVAEFCEVYGSCAFAKHELHGIAGNEVNQQKYQRNYQPDNWDGEEKTAENLLHGLVSTIQVRSTCPEPPACVRMRLS